MKNLARLLKKTAADRSPVIQDLRREVVSVVNSQETTISELEMERDALVYEVLRLRGLVDNLRRERVMKGRLIEQLAFDKVANRDMFRGMGIAMQY